MIGKSRRAPVTWLKFATAAEAASCQSGLDVSDAAPPVIRYVLMHPVTLVIYILFFLAGLLP